MVTSNNANGKDESTEDNGAATQQADKPQRVRGSEVFVGGLQRNVTEENIRELFSDCGEIAEVRMMRDKNGVLKGYCFVRFTTRSAAFKAQKEKSGTIYQGKKIGVNPPSEHDTLFLGNLRKEWTAEELEKMVREVFEDVDSVGLGLPNRSGESPNKKQQNRGFAFVHFTTHAAAARAHRVATRPEFLLGGKWRPTVDWAESEPEPDPDEMAKVTTAFVGNLPDNVTDEYLQGVFEPFGKVERVAISRKGNTPVGFIQFAERADMEASIKELDSKLIDGPGKGPKFKIQEVKHNGSIYGHVYFARAGFSPDPNDQQYDVYSTFHHTISLVKYLPKPKVDKRKNLLDNNPNKEHSPIEPISSMKADSEDEGPVEWISFWKPNVTINLVEDFTQYPRGGVPPNIAEYLDVEANTGNYYPTVFFNEFWLLKDKLTPVNETVEDLILNIEVGPISLTRWQLYLQIDQSFQTHRTYGSMLDGEADELKRVFLEGNPYLLAITMVVSLLHSVFDFLAFKNDIQFWNKNKSMEGLSARSVVVNFVCQLIIFLYLLDNQTSWMIILSSGIGCCIEFWKIGKAMHIEVDRSRGYPLLKFRDRDSYAQNKTKEYDDMAMRYLSYGLYPVVGCFAIYSLLYERHRSWYSWILSSLTSCVYTFGFIMMCPQLFINYKMKSVAHLPWRQMTYKFLNTIIDDLFAFVIKMPTLHRLSVFRDDLVFCVYIYQRWIYPVDTKRVNEFGFGGSDEKTDGEGNLNTADSRKSIANHSAEHQSVSDKVTRRLTGATGLAENGTCSEAITSEVDNKKRN